MAVLPTDIPVGTVTGQFYFVNEDNVDANTDPELTVIQGNVTFTASVQALRMPTKLATIVPLEFKGAFDSNGNLVSASDPSIGLKLPATDSALFNQTGWTWRADFNLTQVANRHSIVIDSFNFQVPTGSTIDLTTVAPVATSPGTLTVQGPQGNAGDLSTVFGPSNVSGAVTLATSDLPSTRLWTMIGNVTLSLPTPPATKSGTITLILTQDATGGRTMTWPAGLKWPDGIVQQPSSTANAISVIHLLWTGTTWYAMLGGKNFA